MSARTYVIYFLTCFFAMLVLVASFDRMVDPFWYYRDISIPGFNQIKTKFRRYERHVKPEILVREQPAAVIFGSSYSEIGFDPLHLAGLAGGRDYNFALAGASWNRVYCDVQFALQYDRGLHWIVLGIHPEAMPSRDCRRDIQVMRHPDQLSFLLSSDALKASFETVFEQRTDLPSHTAEGLYFYTRGKRGTAERFREYLPSHAPCKPGETGKKGGGAREEALDLDGLGNIVRAVRQRGIGMKLVVYPRHAMPVELEYLCGTRKARWETLSRITSMVESEGGQNSKIEIWDFEGYQHIATEKISDAPAVYWQDPAHFNYEYGNIMLDEMFGRTEPDYGTRLTPENIPDREMAEKKAREAYIGHHPEFDAQLISLLRPHS